VYQHAAALAASTFGVQVASHGLVSVLLPEGEEPSGLLTHCSKEFRFAIEAFPFTAKSQQKFTSRLKCQAYAWQITKLDQDDLVLFADADTCCLKPIQLPTNVPVELQAGRVGLVPDIQDGHFLDPSVPWYLAPEERSVYVNSGVILASARARAFFECAQNLSFEPRFLIGPFHDQKVINYALGKHFPGLLLPLDRKLNNIGPVEGDTVIAHLAGGAGFLGLQQRRLDHEHMCLSVLRPLMRADSAARQLLP